MAGLAEKLRNNKYIRVKEVDGLSVYNFTRKAFFNQVWNEQTVTARGLFMDGDVIVGRGYPKFFNIDQSPGFTSEEVAGFKDSRITLKRNGFLVIMFVHNGKLRMWSKGGDSSYAKAAWELMNTLRVDLDTVASFIAEHNISLVWEAVLRNDHHVVSEPSYGFYLLDAIKNDVEGTIVTDQLLGGEAGIAMQKSWGLDDVDVLGSKEVVAVLYRENYVSSVYVNIVAPSDPMAFLVNSGLYNEVVEGFVIRSNDNRMTKVKLDFYNELKSLRVPFSRKLSGKAFDVSRYNFPVWFPMEIISGDASEVRERLSDCIVKGVDGGEELSLILLSEKYGLVEKYKNVAQAV